jgi:hypothetical protein
VGQIGNEGPRRRTAVIFEETSPEEAMTGKHRKS